MFLIVFFFLMIRRPPRSTQSRSSAASDVYKRQDPNKPSALFTDSGGTDQASGEMRVSNFLIWQGAYSEWFVTQTLWPDFDRDEFYKALVEYSHRNRRYGLVAKDGSVE